MNHFYVKGGRIRIQTRQKRIIYLVGTNLLLPIIIFYLQAARFRPPLFLKKETPAEFQNWPLGETKFHKEDVTKSLQEASNKWIQVHHFVMIFSQMHI